MKNALETYDFIKQANKSNKGVFSVPDWGFQKHKKWKKNADKTWIPQSSKDIKVQK
jgi:hypothetical protein